MYIHFRKLTPLFKFPLRCPNQLVDLRIHSDPYRRWNITATICEINYHRKMASYPPDEELSPLGALCIDYTDDIHRPPGDPLNPKSFRFPLIYETIPGITPIRVSTTDAFSEEWLQNCVDTCEKLAKRGAIGIITSCGFLSQVQQRLVDKVSIPVATSSLLQLPYVLSITHSMKHVGVIAYSTNLNEIHLAGVGVPSEQWHRVTIVGSHVDGPLHGIIRDGDPYIEEEMEAELVSVAKELLEKDPLVSAIVLECTQMPPYAKAIQKALHIPVFDAITMIDLFYSGLHCRTLPKDNNKEDGLRRRKRSSKEQG